MLTLSSCLFPSNIHVRVFNVLTADRTREKVWNKDIREKRSCLPNLKQSCNPTARPSAAHLKPTLYVFTATFLQSSKERSRCCCGASWQAFVYRFRHTLRQHLRCGATYKPFHPGSKSNSCSLIYQWHLLLLKLITLAISITSWTEECKGQPLMDQGGHRDKETELWNQDMLPNIWILSSRSCGQQGSQSGWPHLYQISWYIRAI